MLEKEFKYYLSHQDDLVKTYNSKFLVIKDEQIVNVYDTKEDAYFQSIKVLELGTFLIQFCESGESSHTHIFHSRVSFV